MDNKSNLEQFEYKAEMKQLLHIIIHSLYTHPEIFLRELVSNASDALNKVRFKRLTESNIEDPDLDLAIRINTDKENQIFSIEDTGIGMTKDELINQIGTIASSGTLDFLKTLKEKNQSIDGNLIGQFGVGFYSVFMVTDEITIETKSAELNSKSYRWKSINDTNFTIEEIENRPRGTKIYFKLKEDYQKFYDTSEVKDILKKYSNFVDFPIFVNDEKVNMVTALWHRKKDDIKEEELNEFYKFITNDSENPLGHIHISIEGPINFKALLFIPQSQPYMFYRYDIEKTLQLYSNKIFIQDDCQDLLPEYLRFVKGVVDTEDLPLNISREVIQASPVTRKIRNVLSSKIINYLQELSNKESSKYEKFFKNFGSILKLGVTSDFSNKDKIIELLRFETTALPKGEFTSLKDYVSRMKENQKDIYYITGESRDSCIKNPNIEYFISKNIEVLILTDPADIFTIPYIFNYDNKIIKSIEKADIELEKEDKNLSDSLSEDYKKSIIETFKRILGDKVEDVVESKRLVDSPVTLVISKDGLDTQLEKMMQYLDKENTYKSKRILEINVNNDIIKNINKLIFRDTNGELLNNLVNLLYESALLIEGNLKNTSEYTRRLFDVLKETIK